MGPGVAVAQEGDYDLPRSFVVGEGPFYKPPIVYASGVKYGAT